MAYQAQEGMQEQPIELQGVIPAQEVREDDSDASEESTHRIIPIPPLKTFDVFSLIVNKMIGTGIYGAPAQALILTGNKRLTLGLFGIGFVHTIFSMIMYLDFAAVLPYTGGELIYLEEITSHSNAQTDETGRTRPSTNGRSTIPRRPIANAPPPSRGGITRDEHQRLGFWQKFFGDGLLGYVVYSILFISVFNSGTNSMQTGRMILMCIQARPGSVADQPTPNGDLIRFIGVVTLTTLCLIQYFSADAGRKLNRYLATIKILFLVILFIAGALKTRENLQGLDELGVAIPAKAEWGKQYPVGSKLNFAKASLGVLFSFEGWENATFVHGEIAGEENRSGHKYLKRGFIWAVLFVGILYLLVTSVFLSAIPYSYINNGDGSQNVTYAPLFFGNSLRARRAWAIMSAISSVGSLNSIIYTFSRVKQSIGQANILPWSRVWEKDDRIHRDNRQHLINKTPQGGLMLHWLMSVVIIAGSSDLKKNVIESVTLPGYLQTCTHCFILMLISIGYLRLNKRSIALGYQTGKHRSFFQVKGSWRILFVVVVFIYGASNGALIAINGIPPYRASDGKPYSFKGFGYAATLLSLTLFGVAYYLLVFGAAVRKFPASHSSNLNNGNGFVAGPARHSEPGLWTQKHWWNLPRWAGVRVVIRKDYTYRPDLERVYRFGRRWRIQWILGNRPRQDFESEESQKAPLNFLYWFFGGARWIDPNETPYKRFHRRKIRAENWVKRLLGIGEDD